MNIDPLYQRYCFLSQRGRARDAELALDALGKAALECARQMARFRCSSNVEEDVAAEAAASLVRLAAEQRYVTMNEGLLNTIVRTRSADFYRRRRIQVSLDALPADFLATTEAEFADLDFLMSLGSDSTGHDVLATWNRVLRTTTARELAMLLFKSEREFPRLFPYLTRCPVVTERLAHDHRVADCLARLRAGKVAPNTVKQWDFHLRNRINTAGHHLN